MVHGNWTADDDRCQRPWIGGTPLVLGNLMSGSDVQAGAASKHLKAPFVRLCATGCSSG